MPTMNVSDALFARAQSHAIPLVDTLEDVMNRAFDALEGKAQPKAPSGAAAASGIHPYDPASPPNLTHSQPTSIKIDGEEVPKVQLYWNHLMLKMIDRAVAAGYKGQDLVQMMVVPAVTGIKTDHGYNSMPKAGVSVQGQDSNGAWKQIHNLAQELGTKLEIVFRWQNNPKAAHPGKMGSFVVN
jgi:hypothetical protein